MSDETPVPFSSVGALTAQLLGVQAVLMHELVRSGAVDVQRLRSTLDDFWEQELSSADVSAADRRMIGSVRRVVGAACHRRRIMSKVVDISSVRRQLRGGGEPPDNSDMQARVDKLEALAEKTQHRLASIEKDAARPQVDVAVMKSNYATGADVAEAKNSVIVWVVSAILLAQVLPLLLNKLGL